MYINEKNIQSHAMLSVAIEAFSLNQLSQAIKRVFSNAISFLEEGSKKLLSVNYDIPPEPSKVVKKALTSFHKFNYIASSELLVSVPEGFNGNLKQYSTVLLENNPVLLKNTISLLEEFSVFISHVSTTTHFKPNRDLEQRIAKVLKEQEQLTVDFRTDSTMSKAKMGDLFRSKIEVHQTLEDSAKHTAFLFKTKLTPIKLAVDKTVVGINGFMSRSVDLDDRFSKEAVLCLTNCSEMLAKLVDVAALRYFEQKLLIGMIDGLAEQLVVEE